MIQMNTWKRPRLTKKEKKILQNCNDQERGRKLEQIQHAKTITRTSADGWIQRQIEYILANQLSRSSVRFAQPVTGWKGNMQKSRQQNVAQMNICLELMQNYQAKNTPESWTKNGLRHKGNAGQSGKPPKSTAKHARTPHQQKRDTKSGNIQRGQIERYLQQSLTKTYPRKKKNKLESDSDGVMQQKQWIATEERGTMADLIRKRTALQTRLGQLSKKINHMRKKRYWNISQDGKHAFRTKNARKQSTTPNRTKDKQEPCTAGK